VATLEDPIVYEERNDLVPEVYRDLFNNADWIVHRFTVYGVWVYMLTAIACHTSLWVSRPW
jgi:light-harvesting complex 1 beta chain